jgi:hypothetical protein
MFLKLGHEMIIGSGDSQIFVALKQFVDRSHSFAGTQSFGRKCPMDAKWPR